jgi:hypothetical protein
MKTTDCLRGWHGSRNIIIAMNIAAKSAGLAGLLIAEIKEILICV